MTGPSGSATTGRRFLGRYELVRPLAQGGMAELHLARRSAGALEKWLVIKCMRPEFAGDPRFVDLFVREARVSMSLAHRNIVPVFDFGKIGDQVFLAMERVEGKDLGFSLARAASHRLPPVVAAYIAAECCQALDYAHHRRAPDGAALGVVHRDVSPRNLLLSWSGEVMLTDFGIAAFTGDTARRPLGTPQYMAPEQARREPTDPRADLYATGLVLREAISGVCPRPGSDAESSLASARRGELLPWSAAGTPTGIAAPAGAEARRGERGELAAAPGDEPLPPALVAIIDRATAARPADRYPDARSMLEDLDGFIVDHRAAQRGESPARQLAAWLARIWDGDAGDSAPAAPAALGGSGFDAIGTGTIRSMAATADDARL